MQNNPSAPGVLMTGIPEGKKKNLDGSLGPRCNNCSGLGFVNKITGGSEDCRRCYATGIEPPDVYKMAKEIEELKRRLDEKGI
jgi:hypothetical protein